MVATETKNSGAIIDSNDIKSILRIARKNWGIFSTVVLLAAGIGVYYSHILPDIYSAQTEILLKSEDESGMKNIFGGSGSGGLNLANSSGNIDNYNEIEVLKSYDLINKVANKIDVGVSYFIEGRIRDQEMFSGIPFKINAFITSPILYEKEIKFRFIDKYHYKIIYNKNKKDTTEYGTFGDYLINSDLKLQIINNRVNEPINKISNNYYFILHDIDSYVKSVCKTKLNIEVLEKTNILQISLKDEYSKRGVAFLDTLINLYIKNVVTHELQVNTSTLQYVERMLEQEYGVMDTIYLNLQKYQEEKNILDLNRETDQYFSQYNSLNSDQSTLEEQINTLNDLEKYIKENKDPQFLPPAIYINSDDEILKTSIQLLHNLQMQRFDKTESLTLSSSTITNLDNKIDFVKNQLLSYISKSRDALNNLLKDNTSEINKYVGSIKTLPEKARGLSIINEKQDVNEQLYGFLLQQKATVLIERASIIPKTRIIEMPRSLGVVEPKRKNLQLFFTAGGALLAFLIIFIRVTLYEKIENIQELKQKTSLPVLGEILSAPTLANLSVAIENSPKSPLTESFRTLRTNLQYMATDSHSLSKVLLFTSNGPGEGKTFCSINLGAILAKAEKKVLLLEFDLHKPRIHKALNITSEIGLSTILIGKSGIAECVRQTSIPGMDCILCGPIPPNSSELVLSPYIKDILDFGKKEYDYVIVDTPPVGLISDAFILMNYCDTNLFVLNTKFAYKELVNQVQNTVIQNKIKNFAFVLNNVKRRKSKYYYNRYSYGYYGGYGYGGGYGGYGGYGS